MRIYSDSNQSWAVQQLSTDKRRGEAAVVNDDRDYASVSNGFPDVKVLKAAVSQSPEVRKDKVDMLRQAIQDGRYQLSPENVAASMLGQAISGLKR